MIEEKKAVGRPRKTAKAPADVIIRRGIAQSCEKYFGGDLYAEDISLGKTTRLQLHVSLLPYVLSRKESIKTIIKGLDKSETEELVQRIREELK